MGGPGYRGVDINSGHQGYDLCAASAVCYQGAVTQAGVVLYASNNRINQFLLI